MSFYHRMTKIPKMDVNTLVKDLKSCASVPLFTPRSSHVQHILDYYKGKLVGLEGLICAAKTTTGDAMCELAGTYGVKARFYPEVVDRRLLADFYGSLGAHNAELNKAAHNLQMDTFKKTIQAYDDANLFVTRENGIGILDRTRWGNYVFGTIHHAYKNTTDEQFQEYHACVISTTDQKLDEIIYLDVDPIIAHHRAISMRKKPEESTLSLEYMRHLEQGYFVHLVEQFKASRNTECNISVIRNDAFRTPLEVFSIVMSKPTKTFDVSWVDVERCLQDPYKVRAFFHRVSDYHNRTKY